MITYRREGAWRARVGAAAVAAGAVLALACEAPSPTVTDARRAPALHAEMARPPAQPGDMVIADPLVMVDGEKAPDVGVPAPPEQRDWEAQPPRGDIRLWGLNPDAIERIEVIKGEAATRLYGEEGKHGVVQIYTKAGAAELDENRVADVLNPSNLLVFVDGQRLKQGK